jgi:hypothetical protein
MTPTEHRCLQAVETLLRHNKRVSQGAVADLLGKAQGQISRYFRRFEKQGFFAPDPTFLRIFSETGWLAYQKGPDEPERRQGQRLAKDVFTRPQFEVLMIFATTAEQPALARLKENPYLRFVRPANVLDALQRKGFVEIVTVGTSRVWAPTREGIAYLQATFVVPGHPWWKEATETLPQQKSA